MPADFAARPIVDLALGRAKALGNAMRYTFAHPNRGGAASAEKPVRNSDAGRGGEAEPIRWCDRL